MLALSPCPLGACTLDFDRYDPADGNASLQDGGSNVGTGESDDSGVDFTDDAWDNRGDGSTCATTTTCYDQATSCGALCGQSHDTCVKACLASPLCVLGCTGTEQSCLGKCASSCVSCTRGDTCGASSGCLDAAHL
jgi:hypothetical protein